MTDEPIAKSCRNDDRNDYWTCPGCYQDMGNAGVGPHDCPSCGRTILCSLKYIPACVSDIVEADEDWVD